LAEKDAMTASTTIQQQFPNLHNHNKDSVSSIIITSEKKDAQEKHFENQTVFRSVKCAAKILVPPISPWTIAQKNVETTCGKSTWITGPYCDHHTKEIEGVKVRRSQIPGAGLGLFAVRTFLPGSYISQYGGDALTDREVDDRYVRGLKTFRVQYGLNSTIGGRNRVVDGVVSSSGNARYANDARGTLCFNNAVLCDSEDPRTRLKAIKTIHPGDEIFCSYGKSFWRDQ
jgi:hypothetical protein